MYDVSFNAAALREGLSGMPAWHYIADNGHNGIFEGYAWSLDTFVDFVWQQLGALSTIMIVLLVIEVRLLLCRRALRLVFPSAAFTQHTTHTRATPPLTSQKQSNNKQNTKIN